MRVSLDYTPTSDNDVPGIVESLRSIADTLERYEHTDHFLISANTAFHALWWCHQCLGELIYEEGTKYPTPPVTDYDSPSN